MKPVLSLLALITVAIAFSSCSTAYKTGQTPDDVYYSPSRQQDEYLSVNKNDDRSYYGDDSYDDRYLRMKVRNPQMWSDLNDWYYYGDRYNYGYANYLGNYGLYSTNYIWNPYSYWNSYYNPYYYNYVIPYYYSYGVINNIKGNNIYTAPRTSNLNTYNNKKLLDGDYYNPNNSGKSNNFSNKFNSNNRSNDNPGSFLRNIFNGGNSSNNSGSSAPRVNNSSSSSSSSSSSGSTAPVRKF
ncbi:MAG: hypothetical protein B6D37_06745 [Sphingobacteriales bacterium UTBCD1]|jgi:hypothetical protein|nr:MAG: hypothetical protein B6D37_06745 [Sphingobacteriales bacterium UTBCD1]